MAIQLTDSELRTTTEATRELEEIKQAIQGSPLFHLRCEPIIESEKWKYGETSKTKREFLKGSNGRILRGFKAYSKALGFTHTSYGTSGVNKVIYITSEGGTLVIYTCFKTFLSGQVILNQVVSDNQSISKTEKDAILKDLNSSFKN